MFVLHVELKVKPGSQNALEKAYLEVFRPTISVEEGFRAVSLLRPNDANGDYRLTIGFDRQASQIRLVASDEHQRVWPQIDSHLTGFSVIDYTAV